MIRTMAKSDLIKVHAINQENVPAVGDESFESFTTLFEISDLSLVVECSGEVVGFCITLLKGRAYQSPNYLYFCERYSDLLYLDRVAFTADAQGQGLGSELYKELEKRTSAQWIGLEVNLKPLNEGSLRFHERLGFIEVAQEETRPSKPVSLQVKKL